jgi:hypothetical protein
MPLGTNNVTLSNVGAFVPTLWSDEVVASYKSNIVMAQLVRRLNHRGKKGNSITIPNPTRASANAKVAGSQVTLIAGDSDTGINVSINKQYEYSRFIEDIVEVQALASVRRFYTDDGGYAIAKQVDRDLILNGAGFGNGGSSTPTLDANGNISSNITNAFIGDFSTTWNNAANSNAGNAVDLSDVGLRRFVFNLDSVDAPMAGRYLIVSPNVKADMLGWARFTEQAFVGEKGAKNSIRNGLIGDTYAVEVYVTNQLKFVDDATGVTHPFFNLLLGFQRDGLLLVEQMGVRTQTQYKQEWLADLFTADMIYGVATLRSSSVYPIVVPYQFTDG